MTDETDAPGLAYTSAWDAIEDTPAEAANMRMRSELMMALKAHRRARRCLGGGGTSQSR